MDLGVGLAIRRRGDRVALTAGEPSRAFADATLLAAAGASVVAVGVVLFAASRAPGSLKYVEAGFALLSVLLSWTLIHTVYTLKYARLFYQGSPGGLSFNEDDPPQYTDFAYLAFTIGTTFQVSDTDLQSKTFRRMCLHHAWIWFPLGAVIIGAFGVSTSRDGATTLDATAVPVISFDRVAKRYDEGALAIQELFLDVMEGEPLCLVGPSGCGKTTTMKMVNRLVELSSGRVLVQGSDVAAVDPAELRRGIGYVIQQVGQLPASR